MAASTTAATVVFRSSDFAWLTIWAALAGICPSAVVTQPAFGPAAGALLVPYLCWVGFASALTFQVWRLNR